MQFGLHELCDVEPVPVFCVFRVIMLLESTRNAVWLVVFQVSCASDDSLDSSDGIMTKIRAGRLRNRDSVPAFTRDFYLLQSIQTGCGVLPLGTEVSLPKLKWPVVVNNQLDALFNVFIYLFHFSTCFEQPSAHHQEDQLYQYIVWYTSLCVGDCLVCRSGIPGSHPHSDIYQTMY